MSIKKSIKKKCWQLFRELNGSLNITRVMLLIFFIVMIFGPLLTMFANMDSTSISRVFSSPNIKTVIINSIVSSITATFFSIIIAFALAFCIERTNIKFKAFFKIIFILPMLIPSISKGMGLIILFGNNGILTKLLDLNTSIYGFAGIVIGSITYSVPSAYLMISDVMKYEDYSPYEAAQVLGIPRHRQITSIFLPYMRKPLISVIFAVFSLIVTDYGVPLMVGGKYKTIPVVLYQEVIGQLDFGKGAVYGCFLLVPAVVAFVIDFLNKDRGNVTFVSKKHVIKDSTIKKIFAYLLCILVVTFILVLFISFLLVGFTSDYPRDMQFTLANISKAVGLRANVYLVNSFIIAIFTAIIGVVVAFISAYLAARMKSNFSRLLHLFAITSAAIPGLVLGLSYVLFFKSSFVYGTIAILVMVNIIHFLSSPYLMMYNSLSKMNENLEGVGMTLGINRIYVIKDVIIPQSYGTLIEMFSYFFVNSMMTISAVSFLANTSNKPVSLMINQFEAQSQLESAALVSLAILIVNLLIKWMVYLLKNVISRYSRASTKAASEADMN